MVSPRGASDSTDFVPITKIPGTKLYTGIYYKVGMKVHPKGWITWVSGQNTVEIDLDPNELTKYEPGQTYEKDNQLSLGATESDLGFTLTNRGKSLYYLIWVNAQADTGMHVVVSDDAESIIKMSPGGLWRNDALWIPQPTNEDDCYKLENLAKRGSFLSLSNEKHNDFNQFIQLVSNDVSDDSKFTFQPDIMLEGRIYDFVYAESVDDIVKRNENLDRVFVTKKRIPNLSDAEITSVVEEIGETEDTSTIEFNESLMMLRKTTIATGTKQVSSPGGFAANQPRSIKFVSSLPLKQEVTIPPKTEVEASIYIISGNNIDLRFIAKMDITGSTDRILANRPMETKSGNVPAPIGKNIEMINKMEIFSRSGDLENLEILDPPT